MSGPSDEDPVEMTRVLQKIRHFLHRVKHCLGGIKVAEEMMEREGPPDGPQLQIARTMRELVEKLIVDVEAVVSELQARLESVQNFQVCVDAKEKRKGKRKAVSKGVVIGGDSRAKRRGLLKDGIVYGHVCGGHVEVMNSFLWRKLPLPLLELVFDRVIPQINDSTQCRSIRLLDSLPPNKVSRLIYTNSGVALLALGSNAVHKIWKWRRCEHNLSGKATASSPPELWQPQRGMFMTNDISDASPEEAVPCIALSKNDSYVVSASGGKVSLFNLMTFKVMTTCMRPPPAVAFLVFYPLDNNIIAVGMKDSTIQMYNLRKDEVMATLKGHQKRITGLAFSTTLNVLVSSGADAQLCLWSTDTWKQRCTKFFQARHTGTSSQPMGDTHVQFHHNQVRLLVVNESQLAVSNAAAELDYLRQWVPQSPFWAPLSTATYSCCSQLVYAGFVDGFVAVFDAESLQPRCRLAPSVHIPQGVSGATVYPLVIAAHPMTSKQFALGLSDGGVQVIEPLESEEKWGMLTVLPRLAP